MQVNTPQDPIDARRWLRKWNFTRYDDLWGVVAEQLAAAATPSAVEALTALGESLERSERGAWAEAPYPNAAAADAAAAAMWGALMMETPWQQRADVEALLLPEVTRAFKGVIALRGLSDSVARRVLLDLRDGFFYALLGDGGDGACGWLDIALRCLEAGGEAGPTAALAELLQPEEWERVARCLSRRGHWAHTLRLIWPHRPTAPGRAAELQRRCEEAPEFLEAVLDLHVALRLLVHWRRDGVVAGDGDRDLAVVRQNRGRIRGRLRAVLAERRSGLLESLLALDGLSARTADASRRFGWVWAWQELRLDFPLSAVGRVMPPCSDPGHAVTPIPAKHEPELWTWVLLVVLRGRLQQLQEWVYYGSPKRRDAKLERLLVGALPEALRDRERSSGRHGYHRLRLTLSGALPDVLVGLMDTLEGLAALEPDRHLKRRAAAILRPVWSPAVPFPQRGFSSMVNNVRSTLVGLDPLEEAVCVMPI